MLLVSLEEAKLICDKNQYGEASIAEILKLNIRLLYCKATRLYLKRNNELTRLIQKSNLHMMSPIDKTTLKHKLQQELELPK